MDRQRFDNLGLAGLGNRLKEDLECLLYPGKDWVPPRDGVTDIIIIGGGAMACHMSTYGMFDYNICCDA